MRDMIKMVVVITLLSGISGGLLAAVRVGTKEKIAYQQLLYVQGPTIKDILQGCSNDPLVDRFQIKDGNIDRDFFVGTFDGTPKTVAFEVFGKGFKDLVGVMVGVNVEDGKIVAAGVTTHKETPGLGSRAKTDPAFSAQFKGTEMKELYKIKADGGDVDAISGATITSRGVCLALTDAGAVYKRLKNQIEEKLKGIAKK